MVNMVFSNRAQTIRKHCSTSPRHKDLGFLQIKFACAPWGMRCSMEIGRILVNSLSAPRRRFSVMSCQCWTECHVHLWSSHQLKWIRLQIVQWYSSGHYSSTSSSFEKYYQGRGTYVGENLRNITGAFKLPLYYRVHCSLLGPKVTRVAP